MSAVKLTSEELSRISCNFNCLDSYSLGSRLFVTVCLQGGVNFGSIFFRKERKCGLSTTDMGMPQFTITSFTSDESKSFCWGLALPYEVEP